MRKRAGSTRPPGILPEVWSEVFSKKDKEKAIAEYLESLEAAPAVRQIETVHLFPRLPRSAKSIQPHRHKIVELMYPACIARKVSRSEYSKVPEALKALDSEWEKLRTHERPSQSDSDRGVWTERLVWEKADVRAEARRTGKTVHFGRIVELCFEKCSELGKNNPLKKYKGRAVFLGNNVTDESFNWAEFAELSSSPPTMEAARAVDIIGSFPGYGVKNGDAKGAYTQSYLKGPTTWVKLPADRWPPLWKKNYRNPVVPLALALYGHPDAGGCWEL